MDAKTVFDEFVKDIQTVFPDVTVSDNIEETVSHIETHFFPHVMSIVKKDAQFFSEPRVILGIDVSQLWSRAETTEVKDMIWKHLLLCMVASLLHGDIKSKFSRILDIAKSVWNGSGQENDEVSRILNDDASEGRLKEIFDYVMETRIAKVFMEIMESFDPADIELDISSPEQLMEIIRNPEHPIIQKVSTKLRTMLEDKLRRGQFTQQQFQTEIETIKAKVMSVFGGMLLGGRQAAVPSTVLMSNSPEARRQRMLARLQKKVRDKK